MLSEAAKRAGRVMGGIGNFGAGGGGLEGGGSPLNLPSLPTSTLQGTGRGISFAEKLFPSFPRVSFFTREFLKAICFEFH